MIHDLSILAREKIPVIMDDGQKFTKQLKTTIVVTKDNQMNERMDE